MNKNLKLNYIIDIPITAFDDSGNLNDKNWISFLKNQKPIGIIFFADHFQTKQQAKNIIKSVKQYVDKNTFLVADEEGGRINRMSNWINIKSAEELGEEYIKLKKKKGVVVAQQYVEKEYSKMFKEMKDIGLNMTLAPDLDINIYNVLDTNNIDYENYKKTMEYVKLARRERKSLHFFEKSKFYKSWLFYAYLDDIGVRSLDLLAVDGKISNNKDEINKLREEWKNLKDKKKQSLIKEFQPLAKYANYCSVIGDRSYSGDVKIIAEIGKIFVDTAKKYGIKCVLKHALGHGRVIGDTHNEELSVDTSIEQILEDLYPYKALIKDVKFVMPSYIVYKSIDQEHTAISSKKVKKFFIENIGNAVFIGDDMSMLGNNGDEQVCDIHIKARNQTPDDIMNSVKRYDYLKQEDYIDWFK